MKLNSAKAIEEHFFKFSRSYNMFSKGTDTEGLTKQEKKDGKPLRIGVAVSGGPDSVCLALLIKRYQKVMNLEPVVIHVNHHLRGEEADRDEQFVKRLAKDILGFDFVKYDIELTKKELKGNSLEAIAREKRYRVFDECVLDLQLNRIAIAHTMNDNAETMLINMLRGTGIGGVSGIPPVRGYIIRPMLVLSRDNILTYLKLKNVQYVIDSTNELQNYLRNNIRQHVIPELMRLNPGILDHMFFLSTDLREIDVFLNKLSRQAYQDVLHMDRNGMITLNLKKLLEHDNIIIKSVIQLAIKNSFGTYYNPRREHIDYVMSMLMRTKDNSKTLRMLPGGLKIYKNKEYLIFERTDKQ